MDIVCKSGINREVVDCKAEYCSTSIPKDCLLYTSDAADE